jgi:hypothetical protein
MEEPANFMKGIDMLNSFENLVTGDLYQSWFAAMRDQATMQLIAASSMQHQLQRAASRVVESSALLLEQEFEVPFELHAEPGKAKGSQKQGRVVADPDDFKLSLSSRGSLENATHKH